MNLKIAAALAALSVATVPAAFADENAGWYLGGGVGSVQCADRRPRSRSTTPSMAGMKTTPRTSCSRGYRLNKFLAFELDYINLGEPSGAVVPGFNVDAAVDGFAPYRRRHAFRSASGSRSMAVSATTSMTPTSASRDELDGRRRVRRRVRRPRLRRGRRRQHRRAAQRPLRVREVRSRRDWMTPMRCG